MAEAIIQKKPRPKNLDLTTIRLPLPGWVSILHRVSGAGLFLMLPLILWMFQSSLNSPDTFETFRAFVQHPLAKILVLGLLWAYLHHFCAGIRFLALDLHMGLEKETANKTGIAVLVVSLLATAILGGALLW